MLIVCAFYLSLYLIFLVHFSIGIPFPHSASLLPEHLLLLSPGHIPLQ